MYTKKKSYLFKTRVLASYKHVSYIVMGSTNIL